MIRFNRLQTCSTLALLLITLAVPAAMAQSHAGHESAQPEAAIEKPDVVMHVTGLACEMCARSVTTTLKKIEAVQDVQVLLEDDQRILLTLRDRGDVDEETLREAVTNAGFSTRKVVFKDGKDSSS